VDQKFLSIRAILPMSFTKCSSTRCLQKRRLSENPDSVSLLNALLCVKEGVHNSAREKVQDDDLLAERRIGSWSGEQGVKKKWNASLKKKPIAKRQTMPRVAYMHGKRACVVWERAEEKGLEMVPRQRLTSP
jgi:hypothetical protein